MIGGEAMVGGFASMMEGETMTTIGRPMSYSISNDYNISYDT